MGDALYGSPYQNWFASSPALAAGNCVVLKPAEQTPASVLLLAELIGGLLPPGVLNIVNGFGLEAGKPLASSPRIAKIAFTGETTTGRLIMQYASQNLIPVTLELGGKSPNIFFADADFEAAVDGALFGVFFNQGEVCSAGSRILVQRPIYDRFVEAMVEKARGITLGAPLAIAEEATPTPSPQFRMARAGLAAPAPVAVGEETLSVSVTVSFGDGIGPEIMAASLRVMFAAGAKLAVESIDVGERVYRAGHTAGITDAAWDSLRRTKVFFKAPITTPQGGGFKSLNVTIRKTLNLFANVRPTKAYAPFVSSPHPGINLVIIRENEEDLYAGIEFEARRKATQPA